MSLSKLKFRYVLLFFVCILNGWFWKIITADLLLGILVAICTALVFLFLSERTKKEFTISLLSICIIINVFFVINGFDKLLFIQSPSEELSVNTRRSYYPYPLGSIFHNKLTLSIYKYEKNLFANLDINLYFFKSHPRERPGIEEFEKYPQILVAFLFLGMIVFLRSKITYFLIFITIIMGGFLRQDFPLGPVLFFPIITSLISLGFYNVYVFGRKLFSKEIK